VGCVSTGVCRNDPIGVGEPKPPDHGLPMLLTGDGKVDVRAPCKAGKLIPCSPMQPVFMVRLWWTWHLLALVP
jgi:hypothetical protein